MSTCTTDCHADVRLILKPSAVELSPNEFNFASDTAPGTTPATLSLFAHCLHLSPLLEHNQCSFRPAFACYIRYLKLAAFEPIGVLPVSASGLRTSR